MGGDDLVTDLDLVEILDLLAGGDLEQFAVSTLENDATRCLVDRFDRRGDLGLDDASELAGARRD